MSTEADLLQEDEMFHIFYNCILKLEVERKLATVRAIPPSQVKKARLNCSSGTCFAHSTFKTPSPTVIVET